MGWSLAPASHKWDYPFIFREQIVVFPEVDGVEPRTLQPQVRLSLYIYRANRRLPRGRWGGAMHPPATGETIPLYLESKLLCPLMVEGGERVGRMDSMQPLLLVVSPRLGEGEAGGPIFNLSKCSFNGRRRVEGGGVTLCVPCSWWTRLEWGRRGSRDNL
jgi:hypothetical protein